MKKHIFSKGKSFVLVLIAAVIVLGLAPAILEAGKCEEAFFRCMNDFWWQVTGYFGMVYCSNGYIFCKTYIEK
jgi:hypothetical protein